MGVYKVNSLTFFEPGCIFHIALFVSIYKHRYGILILGNHKNKYSFHARRLLFNWAIPPKKPSHRQDICIAQNRHQSPRHNYPRRYPWLVDESNILHHRGASDFLVYTFSFPYLFKKPPRLWKGFFFHPFQRSNIVINYFFPVFPFPEFHYPF